MKYLLKAVIIFLVAASAIGSPKKQKTQECIDSLRTFIGMSGVYDYSWMPIADSVILPKATTDRVVLVVEADGTVREIKKPFFLYLTEHDVCKRRGHEPTGVAFSNSAYTIYTCKWCWRNYRIEETLDAEQSLIDDEDDERVKIYKWSKDIKE